MRRSMMNLPLEIQLDILNRVPMKSLCRLRCVCKLLLEIISSPCFISMHSRSLILTNNIFAEEPPIITLFNGSGFPEYASSLRCNTSSEILSKTTSEILSICKTGLYYSLCFSFFNLICLKDTMEGECCLIDPFAKEVLLLPNSDIVHQTMFGKYYDKVDSHGMGFDYINNTYKIIRISRILKIIGQHKFEPPKDVALVHVLGTSSWREIRQPPFSFCIDAYVAEVGRICAYGDMHWIFHNRQTNAKIIRSFDFTKEEFYFTPHPPTSRLTTDRYITLKGCMAVIGVNVDPNSTRTDVVFSSIDVWVMKDYNTKEWTIEYHVTIPEELNRHYMFYCDWNCGEWDHGFFFVAENNLFFFFDLRDTEDEAKAKYVEVVGREGGWHYRHACNCLRTLISLKQFENSVEDPKEPKAAGSAYYTLLDFSKKYLWNEGMKPQWPESWRNPTC